MWGREGGGREVEHRDRQTYRVIEHRGRQTYREVEHRGRQTYAYVPMCRVCTPTHTHADSKGDHLNLTIMIRVT